MHVVFCFFVFFSVRRPPRLPRRATLFPYPTPVRWSRWGGGLVRPALHWRAGLPDVPVEEAQQALVELDPVGLHIEAVSLRRVILRLDRHSRAFQRRFHL